MQEAIQQTADFQAEKQAEKNAKNFNYNKLQAAICIISSSIVSVALIVWAAKTFF